MKSSRTSTTLNQNPRTRIIEATLHLIAVDGLDAVRHRRVAALAGVSLGSTTYHFASRDDLIEAAFMHYLELSEEFLAQISSAAASAATNESPDASVGRRSIVNLVVNLITNEFDLPYPAPSGLVLAEYEFILFAARRPHVAEHLRHWEYSQRQQLESLLKASGSSHPANDSRNLLALIRGLEIERLTNRAPISNLRSRVTRFVQSIIVN